MKAPDKIYLNAPKECIKEDRLVVATWDNRKYEDCVNVAYIRQYLLMDFADIVRRYVAPTRDDKFCSRSELMQALAKFNEFIK